jgi:hypothetical protein
VEDLPICVRDLLYAARAARPDSEVTCIAFRSLDDSVDIARLGPSPQLIPDWNASSLGRLRPKELLVLTVSVTETTFNSVRKVTHVLVARVRREAGHHHAA